MDNPTPLKSANADGKSFDKQLMEQAASVFRLELPGVLTGGSATGWIAPNGQVVTNMHVVLGAREINLSDHSGKRYKLALRKVDDVNDLALLDFVGDKPPDLKPLKLATKQAISKEPVGIVGYPLGQFEKSKGETDWIQKHESSFGWSLLLKDHKGPITPEERLQIATGSVIISKLKNNGGSSGSPVFNSDLEVQGILKQGNAEGTSSRSVPVAALRELMDQPEGASTWNIRTGYATGVERYVRGFGTDPVESVGSTVLNGGLATTLLLISRRGHWLADSNTACMTIPLLGARTVLDARNYYNADDPMDKIKHGIATTGDATMIAGLMMRFSTDLLKKRSPGIVIASGLAIRFGSELIPNNYITKELSNPGRDQPLFREEHDLLLKYLDDLKKDGK